MTDSEINRTIAESLEPNPDAPGGSFEYPNQSPLGCWSRSMHEDCVARRTSFGPWHPANFIERSDLRDLLQAKLLEDCVAVSICKLGDEYKLRLSRRVGGKIMRFDFYGTRERIWPLAYLAAKGVGSEVHR